MLSSLILRLILSPVFDHFHYAKAKSLTNVQKQDSKHFVYMLGQRLTRHYTSCLNNDVYMKQLCVNK